MVLSVYTNDIEMSTPPNGQNPPPQFGEFVV